MMDVASEGRKPYFIWTIFFTFDTEHYNNGAGWGRKPYFIWTIFFT